MTDWLDLRELDNLVRFDKIFFHWKSRAPQFFSRSREVQVRAIFNGSPWTTHRVDEKQRKHSEPRVIQV